MLGRRLYADALVLAAPRLHSELAALKVTNVLGQLRSTSQHPPVAVSAGRTSEVGLKSLERTPRAL